MEQIGRYEITGEIGHGGMGIVYRGRDPAMRRDVAIKVLTVTGDPVMMARFRVEAATTGNLRHKNIITVYDYGEVDGQPYLVMEFLEGHTLEQIIRQGPPLPLLEKTGVLMQVAEGLHCAHDKGVVHRDVKPSNVMLLDGSAVKILDFGIARLIDQNGTRHTTPGLVIGTVGYMAPEQIRTGQADALTDIFSFGVTCYELLTGVHPFRADSVAAMVYLITTVDPAPVIELAPECPEALQRIVHTALAKARKDRYQNIQEVLFDLARVHTALRRSRAAELYAEAGALLDSSRLDRARGAVDRLLALEPGHTEGHELRRKIQRRREQIQLGETITMTQQPVAVPRLENAPSFAMVDGSGSGIFPKLAVALLIIAAFAAAGGYWFLYHPSRSSQGGMTDGRAPIVLPSATGDSGQPPGAADQQVLTSWLVQHPEYRAAVNADCACDEALRSNPGAHPYTAKGDFNLDGKQDFAAGVINKNTGKFGLLIFNGTIGDTPVQPALFAADLDLRRQGLCFDLPFEKPPRLYVGYYNSDVFWRFVPSGNTYVLETVLPSVNPGATSATPSNSADEPVPTPSSVTVVQKNLPEIQKTRRVVVMNGASGTHPDPNINQALNSDFYLELLKQMETLTCLRSVPMQYVALGAKRLPTDAYLNTFVEEEQGRGADAVKDTLYHVSVQNNGITFWHGILSSRGDVPSMPEGVADLLGALAKDACVSAPR